MYTQSAQESYPDFVRGAPKLNGGASIVRESAAGPLSSPLMLAFLNESQHGLVVVDRKMTVLACNQIADAYFTLCGEPIAVGHRFIDIQSPQVSRLVASVKQAHEGFRSMVLLCKEHHEVSIAVSPFTLEFARSNDVASRLEGQRVALLTTQRTQLCDALSVRCYGQLLGLTDSELKVLLQLVDGQDPSTAAANLALSVTTIRSHIKSILAKSDASCIRSLLLRIAKLPPLKSGLAGSVNVSL